MKVRCRNEVKSKVSDEATKLIGQIKNINSNYGFVFGEDGRDYFFHKSNVKDVDIFSMLEQGSRVSFVVRAAERGPVADELQLDE